MVPRLERNLVKKLALAAAAVVAISAAAYFAIGPFGQGGYSKPDSEGVIGVEKIGGVWWFVDADGEKFIATGMNHIGKQTRFASYNIDFWKGKFGPGMIKNGKVDYKSQEAENWLDTVIADHIDHGFTIIPFHRDSRLNLEYFEKRKMKYMASFKLGDIGIFGSKFHGGYPDVFSKHWEIYAENQAKRILGKLKDRKYLVGYTYSDLPLYTIDTYFFSRKFAIPTDRSGKIHPWVFQVISTPGKTKGKIVWVDILKRHYDSPAAAGEAYGVSAQDWQDLYRVTDWSHAKDIDKFNADQIEMTKALTEKWLKTNHDLIRRHDPKHLIFGDKVPLTDLNHPDWLWEIIGKYVDVVMIQDYTRFDQEHADELTRIHKLTNRPIVNGDHAFVAPRPTIKRFKGVSVENATEVGKEYTKYMEGIMALPFMIGWQNCGYIEQAQGGTDATGLAQAGLFDPFGNPIEEAMVLVEKANRSAVSWHENAKPSSFW